MAKKKSIFKSKKAQNGQSPPAKSSPAEPPSAEPPSAESPSPEPPSAELPSPEPPSPEPSESGAKQPQTPLPLFYKDPHPIHNVRHAGKALRKPIDFGFARAAHAVAIHIQEFRAAATSYPIVFADEDPPMPLAILGIRDGENLFIDENGRWTPGTYIPSYVRRYPFATGQGVKVDEQILYVDEDSDLIVDCEADPDAEPLFVDGEPSERTKEIREFCAAFQQQAPVTVAFVEEIRNRDLLGSKEIRLELPGGGSQLLTGLRVLEEEKLNALPDDVFLEWRRQGWLPPVYWHWASMDNFLRLLQRG